MEKCSKGCVVEPEVIGWRTRAAKHGFLNNVHGSMDNQQSSASTIPPSLPQIRKGRDSNRERAKSGSREEIIMDSHAAL